MSEERRLTITSSPLLSPDDIARHSFTLVRRGFDPNEVRAYLESLAHGLVGTVQREQELLEDLAAADRRAENPVLDEPTLLAALGHQTARVLESAHEVADELTTTAKEEADQVLSEATQRVENAVSAAEARAAERLASADAEATRLLDEAGGRASMLLETAAEECDGLRNRVKDECRAMIEEAQQLRARVLADLARRRRLMHAQIEQLRAGRERLAETIDGVRRNVDEIADDLSAAEDNAREAAESAARALAERPEESVDDLAVELQRVTVVEDVEVIADGESETIATQTTGEVDVAVATGKVDALFAKLRADQDAGRSVGQDEQDDEPGEPVREDASGDATDPGDGDSPPSLVACPGPIDAGPADVEEERVEAQDSESDPGDGPPADRSPAVIQRDELIAPMVTMLARRLKRTLQDTQNELLDQLRSNRSEWSPAILPDETEQIDGFTTAVLPVIEEASEAGVSFASGTGVPGTDELIAVAHGLAEEVVNPLRRRLATDDGVTDAGEAGAIEHVGAAFREWRGPRVDRLAGDYVVAAFSLGSMTAVGQRNGDGQLEWVSVAGSGDAPCPDCEDNGLSGPQAPGESFPTGHRHPPAHSGCRCLVAPAAS